jgi:hypothetical protein
MFLKNIFVENENIDVEQIKEKYMGKMGIHKNRDLILCVENTGKIYGLSLNVICPFNSNPQIGYEFFEAVNKKNPVHKINRIKDVRYNQINTIAMLSSSKSLENTCKIIEKILVANFDKKNIVDLVLEIEA